MVVTFKDENLMTFKHLFLKDYVDGGIAPYALYRQADVYDHIEYVIQQVTKTKLRSCEMGLLWLFENTALHVP